MKDIVKGFIIGIGKIIPGVSGSVIAINLGVYEKALSSINNLFSDFYNNSKYLGKLGLGFIVSICLMSNIISFFLNKYYVIIISLFVGIIIGTTKNTIKQNKKYNFITLIVFFMFIFLNIILNLNKIKFNSNRFVYFYIGFIEVVTMLIPGISGTAIMIMLDVYNDLLDMYSSILNLNYLFNNLLNILLFFIGFIMGGVLIIKLLVYLFNNYKIYMCKVIDGFLYSSIFIMITNVLTNCSNVYQIIMSVIIIVVINLVIKKVNHFL